MLPDVSAGSIRETSRGHTILSSRTSFAPHTPSHPPSVTMVAASFFALAVLASSVLAVPTSKERFAARRAQRQGKPINRVENLITESSSTSTNWAGAVFNSAAGTYKSVTGTFTVPKPSKPSGGSSGTTYSASAWVGIDGDTCGNAILQTGLDFNVEGTSVSYDG
jgi:hypothetical protein